MTVGLGTRLILYISRFDFCSVFALRRAPWSFARAELRAILIVIDIVRRTDLLSRNAEITELREDAPLSHSSARPSLPSQGQARPDLRITPKRKAMVDASKRHMERQRMERQLL